MATEVSKRDAPKTRAAVLDLMKPVSERFDPQAEAQNAALISIELEIVSRKLDRFGWDKLDDHIKQRLSDDWTDVLRLYPVAEVKRAIRKCLDDAPRRCPNEHEVKAAIIAYRATALAKAPKDPPKIEKAERSPEARARMQERIAAAFPALGSKHKGGDEI